MGRKKRFFWVTSLIGASLGMAVLFNNCGGGDEVGGASNELTSDQFSGTVQGQISNVDATGKVSGHALDPQNPDFAIVVHFYIDGPMGSGTYAGSTLANNDRPGTYRGHYFIFDVPANAADGNTHLVYAYGFEQNPRYSLSSSPYGFAAYKPRAQAFYNANIAGQISNRCSACHQWSYNSIFYGPLIDPAPNNGGTATNNDFIRRVNGQNHPNGHCGGNLNSGFCADIQSWWNAEFN